MTFNPVAMVEEYHHGRLVHCYPDRARTIPELLARACDRDADRVALLTPEDRLSYGELRSAALQLARGLSQQGLGPGDRVAVLLPNDARIIIIHLAMAYLGGISVCLNGRLGAPELRSLTASAEPQLAIVDAELADKLPVEALPLGCRRIISANPSIRDEAFRELFADDDSPLDHEPSEDDPVFMLFTSGTTGAPKGALLTHTNVMHSAITYARYFESSAESVTLVLFPLYYATAIIAQLLHMFVVSGCTVVWPRFKAAEVVQAFADYGVTYFIGVPTMYQLMMLQPEFVPERLPRWRVAAYGGSPMPGELLSGLRERFPNLRCFDAYGLTETSSPATIMTPEMLGEKWGSVGRPVPGAEVRVIDEKGNAVAPGEVGELLIAGPMIIPGYWNDPDATARSIVDGWLHTGDVARVDDDEFVFILDRKKDMIMRGGFKIYSVELEYLLLQHPAIREAAIVGVPDPIFFEQVLAVVVRTPNSTLSEEEVRSYVAQRAADYQVPKFVRFVDELPRNATGKVLKKELRGTTLN